MTTPDQSQPSAAELTPPALAITLSISEIAHQTGLSESVLRVWEARYGWPRPGRQANGYRSYPSSLVAVLRAIHGELQRDRTIGDLLRDPVWSAIMESGRLPESPPAEPAPPDFTSVPLPDAPSARTLRAKLEQALVQGDRGTIARIEAQASLLHPRERDHAVTAILRLWRDRPTAS